MRLSRAIIVLCFALSSVLSSGSVASAEEFATVKYEGGNLTLMLGDEKARITYIGERCIGDFTGRISRHSDRITLSDPNSELAPECVFTLTESASRGIGIEQGNGCTAYHGAACSLAGEVHRVNVSEGTLMYYQYGKHHMVDAVMLLVQLAHLPKFNLWERELIWEDYHFLSSAIVADEQKCSASIH